MTFRLSSLAAAILLLLLHRVALAELEPKCVENSPERRGEFGCSYIEDKPLPVSLREPLVWHIDRFDSGSAAQAAVGPTSVAFEAHGSWWLMAIESSASNHHGGKHVATVALPRLPPASQYRLLVYSAYVEAGQTSRVHHHSGVEAFYTVDGEQCLETPTRAYRIPKGGTLTVPAGVTMRLVAAGSRPRRGFAVLVYDAAQPPTTRTPELESQLVRCE
jgi:quercetin dioxygenase-like cupin family protein